MKRLMALILVLLSAFTLSASACEPFEGGDRWQTGDLLLPANCREWVSLRATASTRAERLAKVPLGESVYFLSYYDDNFCHVFYNGQYGYILTDYLTYDGNSIRYVTGCNEWISLREEESTAARRICQIPLGAMVYATDLDGSGFSYVNYGSRQYALSFLPQDTPYGSTRAYTDYENGYALKQYLSLTPFEDGETVRVAKCSEFITLRAEPSTASCELARIPLGAQALITDASGDRGFVQVRYCGETGYVLAGYLEKI